MKTIIYWFLSAEAASVSGRASYQQNRARRRWCVLLADTPQLDPYQPMHNTLNCHQFCIHEWEEALWLISCCYCYQLRLDGMDARPRVCLRQGWQRAVVFVRVCVFFYVLGMGVALFVAVTQVRRGFPRCYFLLTFLFVLASHHMLWLVLPFEGVGPQHNSISPTKHARASSHSKLEVFAPPSESPCRHVFVSDSLCPCQEA